MSLIRFFKFLPEGGFKNRLRCVFYNSNLRAESFRIVYSGGLYRVAYGGVEACFSHSPYWEGLATLPCYFQRAAPKRGDVVVDGGAYTGVFTVLAAKLVGPEGRVLAFEPDPANRVRLRETIGLNGLENVTVIERGLWSGDTTLRFYLDRGQESTVVMDDGAGGDTVEIPVVGLDAELERHGVDRVDFVKLDIEGAELEFVRGAERTLKDSAASLAVASYHVVDGEQTCHRLERMLTDLGYRAETAYPRHLTTYASK